MNPIEKHTIYNQRHRLDMGVDSDEHIEVNGIKVETKGAGNIQIHLGAMVNTNHFNSADKDNGRSSLLLKRTGFITVRIPEF